MAQGGDIRPGANAGGWMGTGNTTQYNQFVAIAPELNVDKIISSGYIATSDNRKTTYLLDKQLGKVYACGHNGQGQLGIPSTTQNRYTFAEIPNLSNVADIATGGHLNATCVALLNDGTIRTWGLNDYGVLGHNGSTNTHIPAIPTNMQNVRFKKVMVAEAWWDTNRVFILALDIDGRMWGCGWNGNGALGEGTRNNRSIFTQAIVPDDVIFTDFDVAGYAGGDYATAVDQYGDLWAVGYNDQRSCGSLRDPYSWSTYSKCTIC